jgi:alpha-1,2-mannosyltransferase
VWAAVVSTVAWLPWRSVAWGWTLLNVALLVWLVRTSYRRLLDRLGTRMPLALAALVAITAFTAPVMGTFDVGQVGLFLTVLVLADMLQARSRMPQGILVGIATAIKLTRDCSSSTGPRPGGAARRPSLRRPRPASGS